jgi:CHAT domain-containing protein
MARQSARFLHALQLLVLGTIGFLASIGIAAATPTDALVNQGFNELNAGQTNAALKTWQVAEQQYRQAGNPIGVAGSLVNQSLAQLALGQAVSACYSATQALQIDHGICRGSDVSINLGNITANSVTPIALKSLGDSLAALGYDNSAEIALKRSLQIDQQADTWMSLGLVYTQSHRTSQAIAAYETAIKFAQSAQDTQTISNVQINLLELQKRFERERIQAIDLSVFPGIQKAQANLQLAQIIEFQQPALALEQAQAALAIARSFNHPWTEAAALRLIGKLQHDPAIVQTAIGVAQSVRAWDLAYPAQALLGQIYVAEHQPDSAVTAYQAAIYSLEQVRQQLKGISRERQFEFYAEVEPIYHQYLELLFDQPTQTTNIIKTSTQRQIAELENFLGCQLHDWKPIEQVQPTEDATFVFVVRGTQHYHVILRSPKQPDYRYSIDAEMLDSATFNLLSNMRGGGIMQVDAETILNYGEKLYDVLLQPATTKFPQTGDQSGTLVFVLDPALQNLPIDFLHDGEDYLLRKYNLSLALGAQLRQPKSLTPKQFKVLLAGIDQIAPSFSPQLKALSQTQNELMAIRQTAPGKILLNQDFTIAKLRRQIASGHYPIVHLSTHGTFSSDPAATGLLTWDQKLGTTELRQIIEQNRQSPIELLVLSACESAKGDQRSILGLAGVAAQAGARSTIASLWLVDESSTTIMMNQFYSGLKSGLPKAAALRQAKLALMDSPDFNHPFFWGSFILIGSWL